MTSPEVIFTICAVLQPNKFRMRLDQQQSIWLSFRDFHSWSFVELLCTAGNRKGLVDFALRTTLITLFNHVLSQDGDYCNS